MKGTVKVFDKEFEYDFLSGWIKYNRLQKGYTQEALANKICSTSHLSYFENGKKKLRGEIIEDLLKKLDIHSIKDLGNIGLIRQKFYKMMFQIESINNEGAKAIYEELLEIEGLINLSPYNIEYKIYELMYRNFVENTSYDDLKQDIQSLDKVYSSLSKELKYMFMLASGRNIYKFEDHDEGIRRLTIAQGIKETPWINYHLGFSYCFNNEYLKGTYYFEKALESYEKNGRYINALWCNNYLGICYSNLKIYEKAEKHYKAALTGAKHFNMNTIFWHVYNNLSYLYYRKEDYSESTKWSEMALEIADDPILPAYNYAEACKKLNKSEEYNKIYKKYLKEEYEDSRWYYLLYFSYLSAFHFEEKIFYDEVTEKILPFYETINYIGISRIIKLKFIEHLEGKRRYKEANKIYKELISEQ